jgi:DNA-binding MarR family transcriptional regulator
LSQPYIIETEPPRTNCPMANFLPLPSLLSQSLVAFTIEFDNEAERRIPHYTTRHGAAKSTKPWLVSMVMYLNCMQFLDEDGMSVRELMRTARARTNFHGMVRWGYITVQPGLSGARAKPPKADWIVRPTEVGQTAQEIWRPLIGVIEDRWKQRFGSERVEQLISSLAAVEKQFDLDLPDCLPILTYGLCSNTTKYRTRSAQSANPIDARLPVLLARVLLALTLEYESESELSLAMSANVVRVLDGDGIPVRELPRLSGVSKEAIAMALGFLAKRGYVLVESNSSRRIKVARLTTKGLNAQRTHSKRLQEIERQWRERFGSLTDSVTESIAPFVGGGMAANSPLFAGLEPPPSGWRTKVRGPETLPHFPMVLHRGGYPDGS